MKFTEKSIRKLQAPTASGKQEIVWADEPTGFGILLSGVSPSRTYIVQRALPSGVRRRVTVGPTNVLSLADATEKAKLILAEFYQGRDPKGGRKDNITLQEVLDKYLSARKSLAAETRRSYETNVRLYLSAWRNVPLRTITADMVEARHSAIQKEVATETRNGHGTANQAMVTLRVLWNYAAELTDLPKNPTNRLKRGWFPVDRRVDMVKADDMPAFYRAVCGLQSAVQRDYILTLLFTGMRRKETATLRWSDVDFAAKIIRIPGTSTKSGAALDLPMTDFLHSLLVQRRAASRGEYVFSGRDGSHVGDCRGAFEEIRKATGICVSAHDLRRTFVTVAESCDVSVYALKGLINHSTGKSITSGYIVMSAERLRDPPQKVADKIKTLCKVPAVEGANVARLTG
jgi:integrase